MLGEIWRSLGVGSCQKSMRVTKPLRAPLPGRPEYPCLVTQEFQIFFYMMKVLEQTVESEHWVNIKLQQKGIVVADGLTSFVTSFVASHH